MGMTHEGWSNRATWALHLHVMNTRWCYLQWQQLTRFRFDEQSNANKSKVALRKLANEIEDTFRDDYERIALGEPWLSLVEASLAAIDYRELANEWLTTWCPEYRSPLDPLTTPTHDLTEIF